MIPHTAHEGATMSLAHDRFHDDVEIGQEAMRTARFIGPGLVGGMRTHDLWEVDAGEEKVAVALDVGTRVISRNTPDKWEFNGVGWVPMA